MSLRKGMSDKYFKSLLVVCIIVALCGVGVYYIASSRHQINAVVSLMPDDSAVVALGKGVYAANCASCHGINLEGQADWRQRDAAGYLPAPPHDENGHTWHHSDNYLFVMTKYGLEKMMGKKYANNMPAYEGRLNDDEIIAVLSYIKSTWPMRIRRQHDEINARSDSW